MRPVKSYRCARRNAARKAKDLRYWRLLKRKVSLKDRSIFIQYPQQGTAK